MLSSTEAASRAIALTENWFPYPVRRDGVTISELALAGLARCRQLLSGMVRLHDAPHLTGTFARTLFETWLSSVYLLLGGDDALARMTATDAFEQVRIAKRLLADGLVDAPPMELSDRLRMQAEAALEIDPSKDSRIDVAAMTGLVGQLLVEDEDPNSYFPERTYALLYGPQSYVSVHGGLGAIKQHILVNGVPGDEICAVPEAGSSHERRLDLSTAMVMVLAHRVGVELKLPLDELDQFAAEWFERTRQTN